MTKDQADELKRLIRAVRDAEHRGTLANETFYATQAEKAAAAYIDSLTQQPAELTDNEIAEVADRCDAINPEAGFWREFARAVIAAHKEKVKV